MRSILSFLLCAAATAVVAQDISTDLARHDFFYAGEGLRQRMCIVKGGRVDWSYENTERRGEISDAILLSDGNVLVAHQFGLYEVRRDSSIVWAYDAPEGTEIHTVQPIGRRHVVFVQNGRPAKAVVMEVPSLRVVREFELATSDKSSVHGQFRSARLTASANTTTPAARWTAGRVSPRGPCRNCPRATCSSQAARASFRR